MKAKIYIIIMSMFAMVPAVFGSASTGENRLVRTLPAEGRECSYRGLRDVSALSSVAPQSPSQQSVESSAASAR